MGKYRICSACGKKNPIDEALCSCNNLLMSSPIEEDDSETEFPAVIENTVSVVSQQARKYKKCPSCGYLNIPSLEFCQQCGDSMDDVFDLVEAPLDEAERASAILREEMEAAAQMAVPLKVDVGQGETWYDAH